jgi:enamine deaminase RidA (YjgF/YER057c/UK114 family)
MSNSAKENLEKMGVKLPTPVAPVANYVPYTNSGNLYSISGQIPMKDGQLPYKGKVGVDISEEDGYQAARLCAINIVAQMNVICGGDLGRVRKVIKLGAFVNCADGFANQPEVVNGASDFMVDVFGEAGKHSRSAVGTNALPRNVSVEIDCLVDIAD